jgi:small subunit ribosomal protein S20
LTNNVPLEYISSIFIPRKEFIMANEKKEEKKVRRPKPLKRDEQNERRRLANRSFKAKMATAIRSLETSLSQKEAAAIPAKLSAIHSLADKGVKTGIYKINKASRMKSQYTARAASAKA